MRRHVFTVVGEDDKYAQAFWDAGNALHDCFVHLAPTGVEVCTQQICRIADIELAFDEFLTDATSHLGGEHQVVFYYVGHGRQVDGSYHLGRDGSAPQLAPFLDALYARPSRTTFNYELLLVVDACFSPHAFAESIGSRHQVAQLKIAASHPAGLAVQVEGESDWPAFTEALVELLQSGLAGKPGQLTWDDIADEHLKLAQSKEKAYDVRALEKDFSAPILFARNAVYERETLGAYLNHLLNHVRQLPAFMSTPGKSPLRNRDLPKLRQPIQVSYALDAIPASLNIEERGKGPQTYFDIPGTKKVPSVLRTVWQTKFLDDNPTVVVIGEPGCGKSWLARTIVEDLCVRLLAALAEDGVPAEVAKKLPIFTTFKKIAAGNLLSVAIRPEGQRFDDLLRAVTLGDGGYVVLDGLDEVDSKDEPRMLGLIEELRLNNEDRRLCILCREQSYLQSFNISREDQLIARILPLHRVEIYDFVRTFLQYRTATMAKVIDPLIERGLLGNPLLLTMACLGLYGKDANQAPDLRTRTDIIALGTERLVGDWLAYRAGQQVSHAKADPAVLDLFANFAAAKFIEEDELAEGFAAQIREIENLNELGLVQDGSSGIEFIHLAIGEYLAARGLIGGIGGRFRAKEVRAALDRLSWRRESETVIFDYTALSADPFEIFQSFTNARQDNSSRHRLRIAAYLVAALKESEDFKRIKAVSRVTATTIFIYWLLIQHENGRVAMGLEPTPDGLAMQWAPAIRALLRANPRIHGALLEHIISRKLDYGNDPIFRLKLKRWMFEGRVDHLVLELMEKTVQVGDFDDVRWKREPVTASYALLLAEPELISAYPSHVMDLIELLAKEGRRGFFDGAWSLLTPGALSTLSRFDPRRFANCCLHTDTGWRFLQKYKMVGDETIDGRVAHRLAQALEEGQDEYTGVGHSLEALAKVGALPEKTRALALRRAHEAESSLPSFAAGYGNNSVMNRVFGVNALQDYLWSEMQDQAAEQAQVAEILPFLIHHDQRVRGNAFRGLVRTKANCVRQRLIYCYAALDRLENDMDVHIDIENVEPRESWNDWTPKSVDKESFPNSHDKMLWAVLNLEEAPLIRRKHDPEPGRFGDVTVADLLEGPCRFDLSTSAPLPTEDFANCLSLQLAGNRQDPIETIHDALSYTFEQFWQRCPFEFRADLEGRDLAKFFPILKAAFSRHCIISRVNGVLQLGLLLGEDSTLYQHAKSLLLKVDKDYYLGKQICRTADAITWFTPKTLPDHLHPLQRDYEDLRNRLALHVMEAGLKQDSGWMLYATLVQLPLSLEVHGKLVEHILKTLPATAIRFYTHISTQLEIACRNGAVGAELFVHLLGYCFTAIEDENEPRKFGLKAIVQTLFDKGIDHMLVFPKETTQSQMLLWIITVKAFSQHPEAEKLAADWYGRMGSKIRWTFEGKAFITLVSLIAKNKPPTKRPYAQAVADVLDRALGSKFFSVRPRHFRNDQFSGTYSPDVTCLYHAMAAGYVPMTLREVVREMRGFRDKRWIFAPGNRFVQNTEAAGFRYFPRTRAFGGFLENLFAWIVNKVFLAAFIGLGYSLEWRWDAYTEFAQTRSSILWVCVAMLLMNRMEFIIKNAGESRWSTVHRLSQKPSRKRKGPSSNVFWSGRRETATEPLQ